MSPKFLPFITILAFISLGGCALLGAMWFVDHQKTQSENDRLQALVSQERDYKAQLQEMLDSNLNTSSELTLSVDTLIKEIKTYDTEVKKSFRVLNGETQILPGANGKVLQDSQDQVKIELDNTEAKLSTSIKQKDDINNKINAIFGSSNQNLQNRADPRDGARQ
jgi:predicted transcriptional regulator